MVGLCVRPEIQIVLPELKMRERERKERECERLRDREHLQTLAAGYEGLLGMLAAKSAAESDDKDAQRRDLEEKVCVCVCVCVSLSETVSGCTCMMVRNACQVAHYKGLLERVVEQDILDGGTGRLPSLVTHRDIRAHERTRARAHTHTHIHTHRYWPLAPTWRSPRQRQC